MGTFLCLYIMIRLSAKSRQISKPRNKGLESIVLQFTRCLDSIVAEAPVKLFENDAVVLKPNVAA